MGKTSFDSQSHRNTVAGRNTMARVYFFDRTVNSLTLTKLVSINAKVLHSYVAPECRSSTKHKSTLDS